MPVSDKIYIPEIMVDIDMMDEDKENVPVDQDSMFSYAKITNRLFKILPVYFNRKRRRSSEDSESPERKCKKPNMTESGQLSSISIISKSIISLLPSRLDPKDNENQYVEYIDYMNQRNSFD